ncbi:uncharacterized protein LOC126853579 [Cataglyphis hispanica]|uniref:uncharacterized protein LOC126853579 n=1 Tax=Cataglyphis hispanica TaxID=1086592 RepID=UPI00217FBAA8|nr:uncharacterized protein LOC126853579 [Cataglyphis hispanica]
MEFRARPFNMETVFAQKKRKQTKKLRGPDSPLYVSIWPMVYVVRVFGLAPYDFLQDRLVPSNTYLIFSATAAILYTCIFYMVLHGTSVDKLFRGAIDGTENTKMIINYVVTIYGLGLTVFTRRSFTKTWNALQDYDEDVRQLGYPRKEKQTAIVAWIVAVISTVIWVAINRIGMYAFFETWAYNTGYLIVYVGNSIAVYKFVATAFFLGQRFHHLNAMAIKNLPSTSRNKNVITISKTTIRNLHNDLMVAAENLESIYSWSLLFWLGNLGLHIVSNIFHIVVWILESGHEETRKPISWPLVYCFWVLAFLLQLLLLHIACHYASSQANYISIILMEWQVKLMKRNEYVESLLQFQNRRLNFSAGGCFCVNLPLLHSIAALLTTYLVILLQLPK